MILKFSQFSSIFLPLPPSISPSFPFLLFLNPPHILTLPLKPLKNKVLEALHHDPSRPNLTDSIHKRNGARILLAESKRRTERIDQGTSPSGMGNKSLSCLYFSFSSVCRLFSSLFLSSPFPYLSPHPSSSFSFILLPSTFMLNPYWDGGLFCFYFFYGFLFWSPVSFRISHCFLYRRCPEPTIGLF